MVIQNVITKLTLLLNAELFAYVNGKIGVPQGFDG